MIPSLLKLLLIIMHVAPRDHTTMPTSTPESVPLGSSKDPGRESGISVLNLSSRNRHPDWGGYSDLVYLLGQDASVACQTQQLVFLCLRVMAGAPRRSVWAQWACKTISAKSS